MGPASQETRRLYQRPDGTWYTEAEIERFERFALSYLLSVYHTCSSWLNHMGKNLPDKVLQQLCWEEQDRFFNAVRFWHADPLAREAARVAKDRWMCAKIKPEDLPNDLANWNEARLIRSFEGWRELFHFESWHPKGKDPFFAVLSKRYVDLPRQITLGPGPFDVMQRQFDRVYVPHPYTEIPEMLPTYYNFLAPFFESEEFVDPFYKEALIQRLCEEAGVNTEAEEKILDVGIGTGFSRFVIPTDKIYGVDFSEEMCYQARKNGVRVCQANAEERLPFPDGLFDGGIASYTAHCFRSPMAYAEIKRVLKDGARVALNLYKPEMLYPELGVDWREEFATMLTEVGLREIRFSTFEFQSPTGQSYRTDIISATA